MEEKDIEQIERYFRHALEEEERAAFERRMAEDAGFAREVQLHGLAMEAIRMEGEALLRARLTQKGKQLDEQSPAPGRRKWLWAIPVVLLGAFAIWQLSRPLAPAGPAPAEPTPQAPAAPPAPPRDTLPQAPPSKEEPKARERTDAGGQERELFAAWFQPYRDDSLEPLVRGDGDATPEEHFYELYWKGQYRQALAAFDNLEPESKNKGDVRFLKANALLAVGNAREAIPLLESPGRTRFQAEAEWLLALAYLKSGQRDKALAQLNMVAANASSPRREAAQQVLKAMN